MDPTRIALNYDQIATWWQKQHQNSTYGLPQFERALQFVKIKSAYLDVGCGSSGRFIESAIAGGFTAVGVDIAPGMIEMAKRVHPFVTFYTEDICNWVPPQKFDLITAWDSTFHLPIDFQEPVIRKLCETLNHHGVLMFTCGREHGEIVGEFQGLSFGYSSLGIDTFIKILFDCSCSLLHVEIDQMPESHVTIIAKKV